MTVKDLIEKLQGMPPDAVVIIDMMSESSKLDEDQPRLITPADKWIERNGTYMEFKERWWDYKRDGQPHFVTACHFPGN